MLKTRYQSNATRLTVRRHNVQASNNSVNPIRESNQSEEPGVMLVA